MDYSDMDSDSEEEERRRREMEDLLYSQVHHQEEGDEASAAAVEDVALRDFCDVGAAARERSPRRTETEEVAAAVSAADSGVASLAASSPEPEVVDLASSDSDDDGIQGGNSCGCCERRILAQIEHF